MIALIWYSLSCWKAWILPRRRVCFGGKKKFISVLTRKFDSLAIIFCKKKVKLDSEQLPVYSWEICQTHYEIHLLKSDILHLLLSVPNGFLQLFSPLLSFKIHLQKMIRPRAPPSLPTGGSVRTAPSARRAGRDPSMALPTLTILLLPCSRCFSASPWRAGQMCSTGYVSENAGLSPARAHSSVETWGL